VEPEAERLVRTIAARLENDAAADLPDGALVAAAEASR
jgi:hypothetical protein